MAGKSTISITFKLDGDGNGFKKLANDANGFKKALNSTLVETQKFNTNAINFAAIATGINQMQNSVTQLQSTMKDLTAGYNDSKQAETQLVTVMQQRMAASNADVESINGVIRAQTELGVISGTVQKRGAQQIATFLTQKKSLETLIPAMNNLIAQQKGINATQEDAYSVANLMGKAMQGQTSALRRVGITFTAAQEQVMKYGDENQRAAMLSQIITDNVGNMNAELGKTDIGKQKQLENAIAGIKNQIGGLVQGGLPFVTMAAQSAIAAGAVVKLAAGVRAAIAATVAWDIKNKAAGVGMLLLGLRTSQTAVVTRVFSAAMTSGAFTATAFKIALRGLMITTGVGAAIAGVTMLVEYFANSANKATDSTGALMSEEERAKQKSEEVEAARNAENEALEQTRAALEINIQRLKQFHGTKQQEKSIVEEMNNTYGQTMGYFSSVASWYNALVKNSEVYCRQMVIEAKTRMLANQIAQKEQETHNLIYNGQGGKNRYSTKRDTKTTATGQVDAGDGKILPIYTTVEVKGSSDLDKVNTRIRNNNAEVKNLRKQLTDAVKDANKMDFAVKGSKNKPSTGTGKVTTPKKTNTGTDKERTRLQELSNLIDKAKNKYVTASDTTRAEINKKIVSYKAEQANIELLMKQAERPIELNSLQDIDDELQYQQALRARASKENLAGIDAEIKRLDELRKQMDKSGHTATPIGNIKTYEQLNKELSYYTDALNTSTVNERGNIQLQINALEALKKKWDNIQADFKKPGDISTLNSIEDLDDAITYYSDLQKRQSTDEVQNTQKVINALEEKKKAIQRGIDIPGLKKEADEINGLKGKDFRIKIQSIGIDEIKDKIKGLQAQLSDLNNPPTENQRKDIESLIGTYQKWENTAVHSFDTYKAGWDGIKGIGDSIESITGALEGNGDAWQSITAIIDGFVQLYESISTIVGIIDALTGATETQTAAKTAEAAATTAATGATGANATVTAAAAASNAGAAAAESTAATGATTAYVGLAAAKTMAAHASIPFVGIAIAAGAVAAMVALMTSLPKFANGGVISGPTLGLMGEYPGASSNPEVVAPLDKLRGMLQSNNVAVGGEFRVKGRDLVAAIANETRITSKSGKKTNIRL
jgi:hypothetical protein